MYVSVAILLSPDVAPAVGSIGGIITSLYSGLLASPLYHCAVPFIDLLQVMLFLSGC